MALPLYLALTAAEFQKCSSPPEKTAWMACHYSPYGLGLSNIPDSLPAGSMLILNDRTPPCRHNPQLIAGQLGELVEIFQCSGVLLDFQRPDFRENEAVARAVIETLDCPIGVSELYAPGLDCPVFLPPAPLTVPLKEYLSPWQNREIWLEAGLNGETVTVTESDSISSPLPHAVQQRSDFSDDLLCCHYRTRTFDNHIEFTLWRTEEDLSHLLWEAKDYHVTNTIGLFQELKGNK